MQRLAFRLRQLSGSQKRFAVQEVCFWIAVVCTIIEPSWWHIGICIGMLLLLMRRWYGLGGWINMKWVARYAAKNARTKFKFAKKEPEPAPEPLPPEPNLDDLYQNWDLGRALHMTNESSQQKQNSRSWLSRFRR